jgi:hypothetical protein
MGFFEPFSVRERSVARLSPHSHTIFDGPAGRRQRSSDDDDRSNNLSDILPIVLDYISAGKVQTAWTFYDESYKLSPRKN